MHTGPRKTTILTVRCTKEEADAIREQAQYQHRTISTLMLHATMNFCAEARIRREDYARSLEAERRMQDELFRQYQAQRKGASPERNLPAAEILERQWRKV